MSVYLVLDGSNDVVSAPIAQASSVKNACDALRRAAGLQATPRATLRLYSPAGTLVPIGPNTAPNTSDSPYRLVSKPDPQKKRGAVESVEAVSAVLSQVDDMKKSVALVRFKIEQIEKYSGPLSKDRPLLKPATRRANKVFQSMQLPINLPKHSISNEVFEQMKAPTFDIWMFRESELIHLMMHMFAEFDLIKTFQIDEQTLYTFLWVVKSTYNRNPFHNFQHCFCVTQMMYALLHVTSVHKRLTSLEKLALIVAAIGHDMDHPGFNNAYQINACTDLATTYNDMSPLENHHAAVLFTILNRPETNILGNLSAADYKEARKIIILCILATDMAKHGEIMSKFKGFAENFSYEDANHRQALFQILIKCSDISNEVRPKHVSEPWVDNLLEEFFSQSDREKLEGLPTAPFMDREKVTKPSAQVGFIGFVMIPLFELASKVLPDMEEPVLQPIRKALDYYKSCLDSTKKA
ncbi:3',5'-cyclic-nucleotide phosphodiesterase [Polyrhizophydium stewartii]|uniref:Phosphodiesterase n=1 Tax=Polyrhizophydium stewartii TaxID=2732419 RepID=A0ABR4NGY4_9FUNG